MSIVLLAVSTCIEKALIGKTYAGDNILLSDPTALHIDAKGNPVIGSTGPFVRIVAHQAQIKPQSQEIGFMCNGVAEIEIETGVTAAMAAKADENGNREFGFVGYVPTSANMDKVLNLLDRQLRNVLSGPDQWASLFRLFLQGPATIELAGLISGEDGQRLAARQMKIKAPLIDEPELDDLDEFFLLRDGNVQIEDVGLPIVPIARFVWLLHSSTDPSDQSTASEILDLLSGDENDFGALAQRLGFTPEQMTALGLAQFDPENPDVIATGEADVTITAMD